MELLLEDGGSGLQGNLRVELQYSEYEWGVVSVCACAGESRQSHPWMMKVNHVFGKQTILERQNDCCLYEEGRAATNVSGDDGLLDHLWGRSALWVRRGAEAAQRADRGDTHTHKD